ncbi:unnamed protein product [Blepharisma stoltei]|uniref:C2H2-type domain-containing protein n=1 Tax=Blepharisma stoltei TaxID=1481888 RepID=A0AAU9K3R0_9CILI|nr:unnamed protein product [Blepharisma stoltei]
MTSIEDDLSILATEEDDSPNSFKGKRRSKRDLQGRTYKCGCEKMYLSYPALYTHIKTKHDGITPPGTETPNSIGNRGRGRPRKMPIEKEEKNDIKESLEENPLEDLEILGGQTDPINGFDDPNSELLNKIKEWKNKPAEEFFDKENLSCDDAFAAYLIEISENIGEDTYKNFILFFENLRICLNLRGYQLHLDENSVKISNYSKTKGPEKIPGIFNYYIQQYMPLNFPSFNKSIAIKISLHFDKWLLKNNLTDMKILLTDEIIN